MGELDQWKHCPRCGSTEIVVEKGQAECPDCGFRAYASSKPTASAVCLDDEGRVLLSRRGEEPFKGMWDLPGGFLDEEEHPLDCLRRELREEGGVEVEPLEFLGVWIDKYGGDGSAQTTLNFYWTARIVEGDARAGRRRGGVPLVRARRGSAGRARLPAHPRRAVSAAGEARVALAAGSRI